LRQLDWRYAIATALLAGRDGDLPPVLDAPVAAQASLRPRGDDRQDRRGPELDRLAHRIVHRVGRQRRDHERGGERRFALDRIVRADRHGRAAPPRGGDRRAPFASRAVEQRHRVAVAQPQHAQRVVRGGLGQLGRGALRKDDLARVDEEPRRHGSTKS
jgi:hypothetical protein